MRQQKQQTGGNWPIPSEAMAVFRKRKRDKGVPVTRSIRDALEFALRDENIPLWQ